MRVILDDCRYGLHGLLVYKRAMTDRNSMGSWKPTSRDSHEAVLLAMAVLPGGPRAWVREFSEPWTRFVKSPRDFIRRVPRYSKRGSASGNKMGGILHGQGIFSEETFGQIFVSRGAELAMEYRIKSELCRWRPWIEGPLACNVLLSSYLGIKVKKAPSQPAEAEPQPHPSTAKAEKLVYGYGGYTGLAKPRKRVCASQQKQEQETESKGSQTTRKRSMRKRSIAPYIEFY